MIDKIIESFKMTPIWELALIFFARIFEVSLGTLRVIFINKGYRKQGVILAFIEVSIWVFVASRVIVGITAQPLKGVIYSLGFASGVFVGSKIEERLAFGKVIIQAITSIELGQTIADSLRKHGLGVTTLNGRGKDAEKTILMIYANRRGKDAIIEIINNIDPQAMVVSSEVDSLKGGYISNWRRIIK
ncbi:MAG: DUF5698 domain-containing protein [Bacilli bacterium]|nr:DUF5698 domain-containing protein [Bacilli bacterium]MDD4077507.1 DUF5698 domain-containing protein [Bacilli bacterium]MDD4388585.1 DUF5698 domain-containing protein [Bacilli bacterium]